MSQDQNNMNYQYSNPNQSYPYYYPQAAQAQPYYTRQMPLPSTQPSMTEQGINVQGMLPIQQSYIENILRLNKGKIATVYMTFNTNSEKFIGIIEAAGRDHIIISNTETGKRYLLLMVYLDYITFDEEITYAYPYNGTGGNPNSPSR